MPITPVYNTKGEKAGKVSLPKEIFTAKINKPLMAQSVRVYLSNKRQSAAKAKTRGEIKATGKKIYRQKGTGKARHGSRKAPIFVKGGKAHGPTGRQNYKLKMSKKMKKLALFSALTFKLKTNNIIIVTGLDKIKPKTKEVIEVIKKLKIKSVSQQGKEKNLKITIVLTKMLDNIIRGARNVPGVKLSEARLLNTYAILNGGRLIFAKESLDELKKTFLKKKAKQ